MTATAVAPPQTYFAPGVKARKGSWDFARNEDGTARINHLHIFRTGSFKDSRGVERTYSLEDLSAMADNFAELREDGTLPDVPVRADHGRSVNGVVGYFDRLYVEGEDLFADLDITEPEAADKWDRGTYRSRSLEVGAYETNGGDLRLPVVQGVAFVDLPAVEGLFSRPDSTEEPVSDEEFEAAVEYAAWVEAAAYAQYEADLEWAVAAAFAEGHDAAVATFDADTAPHQFTIDGAATAEYAAVQSHIDTLEQFKVETFARVRSEFVEALAADGKIGQPQVDPLKEAVALMGDDAYEAFCKSYEEAPQLSIFGSHDPGAPEAEQADADADRIRDLEEILAYHRQVGASDEFIESTESYKELTLLKEGS